MMFQVQTNKKVVKNIENIIMFVSPFKIWLCGYYLTSINRDFYASKIKQPNKTLALNTNTRSHVHVDADGPNPDHWDIT